ncbi:hypothetical protein RRG08_024608 [Elysia crispata]|uniref:G-protein coupled receptors family 1 profile domain-containing protein n=1 Tax=Elysia crispata TaxID=231223 RepID=A0AAE0ZXN6_9GAST|nr:hypothetical protein RRG08_024608 [Elysia crispata]
MISSNESLFGENDSYYRVNISYTSSCVNTENSGVSDEMRYFILVFRICLCPLMSVWSIVTGIVNIIVFSKLGLGEGLNQNFLILSVADALQGLFNLGSQLCYAFNWFGLCFESISFTTLYTLFGVAVNFSVTLSNTTTTVIAVVRCCCVTMPFAVRKTLTARRQLVAICCSCSGTLAIFIYALASGSLNNMFRSGTVSMVWDGARVSENSAYFIIIFISMIILVRAVKNSKRFPPREVNSGLSTASDNRNVRDARILRGVFLVLAIFTTCNVLIIPIAILRLFMPELRHASKTKNEFFYLMTIKIIFSEINTSINIFVYYFNDGRFRKVAKKLFYKNG